MILIVQDTASAALAKLAANVADKRPILKAVGSAIAELAGRAFNDESVRAAPWAPLAPATVAQKLKAGTMTAILKRHGLLWHSFRVGAVTVGSETDASVTVVSDRPYAGYHQTGTARMPARPMLPITTGGQLTLLARRNLLDAAKAVLIAGSQ